MQTSINIALFSINIFCFIAVLFLRKWSIQQEEDIDGLQDVTSLIHQQVNKRIKYIVMVLTPTQRDLITLYDRQLELEKELVEIKQLRSNGNIGNELISKTLWEKEKGIYKDQKELTIRIEKLKKEINA